MVSPLPRLVGSLFRSKCRCVLVLAVSTLAVLVLYLSYKAHLAGRVGKAVVGKKKTNTYNAEVCPFLENDASRGPISADTDTLRGISELEQLLGPSLIKGGHYTPQSCRSQQKVAVIVPYRDRHVHLKKFLWHMHPFLQRQMLEYGIFVIEQDATSDFNRGLLMNIGFKEALKLDNYSCFVFHDVDLLPLDDRILYRCLDMPIHLSAAVDTLDFKLMYDTLFGGACSLSREMIEDVNGFSNLYFGWGGEDDDMSYRIRSHGMKIVRYKPEIAKYTMIKHMKADQFDRSRLFASSKSRIHSDGLNSLKYERLDLELRPLYTWIRVKLDHLDVEAHLSMLI